MNNTCYIVQVMVNDRWEVREFKYHPHLNPNSIAEAMENIRNDSEIFTDCKYRIINGMDLMVEHIIVRRESCLEVTYPLSGKKITVSY